MPVGEGMGGGEYMDLILGKNRAVGVGGTGWGTATASFFGSLGESHSMVMDFFGLPRPLRTFALFCECGIERPKLVG